MKLVQRHLIKSSNKDYKKIDKLAFLSKNLYNCAVYINRQAFFNHQPFLTMTDLHHQLKTSVDYQALPAKVSQLILKQVEKTFKSYCQAISQYKKNPDKFTGCPKLPRYKHKEKGRNLVIYNYQAISKKALKNGLIQPSGTNLKFKTELKEVAEVRIIPQIGAYCLEIVYEHPEIEKKKGNRCAFVDLGLNNLAAITSNNPEFQPTLVCGRALKSCNQKYHKTLARLKSELPAHQKTSKRIQGLTLKRNCKVDYYLHTASRYIINLLEIHQINLLVIGQNQGWKQNINIGDKNNQSFVNIPHAKFIEQLTYKANLVGIEVITTDESYTSKCSFLDLEPIQKQESYLGKRVKRGLFRSSTGYLYGADINGSLNIGRKVVGEVAFSENPIERFVVNPVRVKAYKADSKRNICVQN
jgi:IS605 OrfB family transposase